MRTRSGVLASEGEVEYLDVEDLLDLAARLLGDACLIRDAGLLGWLVPATFLDLNGIPASAGSNGRRDPPELRPSSGYAGG